MVKEVAEEARKHFEIVLARCAKGVIHLALEAEHDDGCIVIVDRGSGADIQRMPRADAIRMAESSELHESLVDSIRKPCERGVVTVIVVSDVHPSAISVMKVTVGFVSRGGDA